MELQTSYRLTIVFVPKYRRKVFYGKNREEIGKILRELCGWKGVRIIEAEVCPDHIHMLVEIPPKMSVSSFVGLPDHIREAREPEIQAREQIFLVPGLLGRHRRQGTAKRTRDTYKTNWRKINFRIS